MPVYHLYFSPCSSTYDTTYAFCRAISQNAAIEVNLTDRETEVPEIPAGSVAVVAAPVYAGRIPTPMADKLARARLEGVKVVTFAVYGGRAYEDALLELNDVLLARGATPVASAAIVAQHSMAPSVAADRPTATDYQNLSVFSRFALQKYDELHAVAVQVPGNRPYRAWSKMPVTPVVSGKCIHCGQCIQKCPTMAIWITDPKKTDPSKCILCMRCVAICPQQARQLPAQAKEAIEKKLAPVAKLTRENEFFF